MADWDFIGFTYNGKHSIRDLGIYRVSSGNRYEDNITAAMTDKTVDVPGGDGQYYFGTTFKNRTFKVDYAFDDLTEEKIALIKQVFRGDGIHDLVFDEAPYKVWSAKVTGTASMKHLCFDEGGVRKYKGEGSITFTSYFPYAHTPTKLWEVSNYGTGNETWAYVEKDGRLYKNYQDESYPNKNQWRKVSDLYTGSVVSSVRGELPIPHIGIISEFKKKGQISEIYIREEGIGTDTRDKEHTITFNKPVEVDEYSIITWDTKTGLCTIKHGQGGSIEVLPYTGNGIIKFAPGCFTNFRVRDWTYDGTQMEYKTELFYQYLYY